MTYDPHASAEASVEPPIGATDDGYAVPSGSQFPDPDAIKQQTFTEARRGYDPEEVHAFLVSVAEALHDSYGRENELELRISDLQRQLYDAQDQAATAEHQAARAAEDATAAALADHHVITSFDDLDEGELAALVGEETAKVLAAARNAAAGIVANAERTASQMRSKADRDSERLAAEAQALVDNAARDADAEAARRLNEADTAIGLAHAEAERHAAQMRADAEASVAQVQADATRRLDDAQTEAASIVDHARHEARGIVEQAGAEGQALVTEAQAVRSRMLEDLLRRRKLLRRQVEQLHAGRERLAAAFGVVHDSMSVIDAELGSVLAEAKTAAEAAAARADASSDAETDELQAMADASRAAAAVEVEAPEEDDAVVGHQSAVAAPPAPTDAASSLFTRLKADPTLDTELLSDGAPVIDDAVIDHAADLPPNVEATGDVRVIDPSTLPDNQPVPEPAAARDDAEVDETALEAAAIDEPGAVEAVDVVDAVTVIDTPAEIHEPATFDDAEPAADEPAEPIAADEVVEAPEAVDAPDDVAPAPASDAPRGRRGSVSVVKAPVGVTDEVLEQRDGLLDDLTRAVVRRMKRLLTDEQNELLDTIRQKRPLPRLDEFLAPEAEHERRYAEAALPALRNASSAGQEFPGALHAEHRSGPGAAATTAKQKGARATAAGDPVKVIDLAAVLAVDVVGPLRARLEECMSGSGAESLRTNTGSSATKAKRSAAADALADEVRLAYREIRNRKVDASASTAVRDAFARGLEAAPSGDDHQVIQDLLAGLT